MAREKRFTRSLPGYLRTGPNMRSASLEDALLEPEEFEVIGGQVGSPVGVPQSELDRNPFLVERDAERQRHQLTVAAGVRSDPDDPESPVISGALVADLVGQIRLEGGPHTSQDLMFGTAYYAWTPPIDYDSWTNFQRYYWTGEGTAKINGEFITRDPSGSQTVFYKVASGVATRIEAELSSTAKASFTNGSEVGDLREDCTDADRKVYRWTGSTWRILSWNPLDSVPDSWNGYANGYYYVASTSHEGNRPLAYQYTDASMRWVPRLPIVSMTEPESPVAGAVWEDCRASPSRPLYLWNGTAWSKLSWTATDNMSGVGTASNGTWRFHSAQASSTDSWGSKNWWRHYDDLSHQDRAIVGSEQATRPILQLWGSLELFTNSSRSTRHDEPKHKLYAYKPSTDSIAELSIDNFGSNSYITNGGSTIVRFRRGTGSDDSTLGFPISWSASGEIEFDATIEDSISFDTVDSGEAEVDGLDIGYRYFKDSFTNKLRTLWVRSDTELKPSMDEDGTFSLPRSLSDNPDHLKMTYFSRSEVLGHFSGVIGACSTGDATSSNSWRWSSQCLASGAKIIDPEWSLLPSMSLLSSNRDLPSAIRRNSSEYSRMIGRIDQAINDLWNAGTTSNPDGTLASGFTLTTAVDRALSDALQARTSELPFWNSDMGTYVDAITSVTRPISIPASPARVGAVPAVNPHTFTDREGVARIACHDGSIRKATGDARDDMWLNLENRFFAKIPTERKVESTTSSARIESPWVLEDHVQDWEPEATHGSIASVVEEVSSIGSPSEGQRVFETSTSSFAVYGGGSWIKSPAPIDSTFKVDSGEWRRWNGVSLSTINTWSRGSFDYSITDLLSSLRREFTRWSLENGVDFADRSDYSAIDPFTWNYTSSGCEGNYRGIYRRVYGTYRPHSHPWECLGFFVEPTWWRTVYVPTSTDDDGSPRYGSAHAMWADIKDDCSDIAEAVRPGATRRLPSGVPTPVDASGDLLDPIAAGIVDAGDVREDRRDDAWEFGDLSPLEADFFNSRRGRFALALAGYLMKPGKFGSVLWEDGYKYIGSSEAVTKSLISSDSLFRTSLADVKYHGTRQSDLEVPVSNPGIHSWVSESVVMDGGLPTDLEKTLSATEPMLCWPAAGFLRSTRTVVRTPAGTEVPFEDVHHVLTQSQPRSVLFHSGVNIVKDGSGYRVYGYDSVDPHFYTEPSERPTISGKLILEQDFTYGTTGEFSTTEFSIGNSAELGKFSVILRGRRLNSSEYIVTGRNTFKILAKAEAGDSVTAALSLLPNDSVSRIRTFEVDGHTFYYYPIGSGEVEAVPYGTWMDSPQSVVEFLVEHGRWMDSQGWKYQEDSWLNSAKRFASWASSGREDGDLFIEVPGGSVQTLELEFGKVFDLTERLGGTYSILDVAGLPIEPSGFSVSRSEGNIRVESTDASTEIYGVRAAIGETQHLVFMSSNTRFSDTLYDPLTSTRYSRLIVKAYRTIDWSGRLDIPGYLPSGGNLLPNLEKRTKDVDKFYDVLDPVGDGGSRSQAMTLYGNDGLSYVDDVDSSSMSQESFHRGMIRFKGTTRPLLAFARGIRDGNSSVGILPVWAWKRSDYGRNGGRTHVRFSIEPGEIKDRVQRVAFVDTDVPADSDIEVLPFTRPGSVGRWILPPEGTNHSFPVNESGIPLVAGQFHRMGLVRASTNEEVFSFFHWDPALDLHEPLAFGEVDDIVPSDPARYTHGPAASEDVGAEPWDSTMVGSWWWDTSILSYDDYRVNDPSAWGQTVRRPTTSVLLDSVTKEYTVSLATAHGYSANDSIGIYTTSGQRREATVVESVDTDTFTLTLHNLGDVIGTTKATDVTVEEMASIADSDVAVYEWVSSTVPPDEWGGDGMVKNATDPSWVQETNPVTRAITYYFWVRRRKLVHSSKCMSVTEAEDRLRNPSTIGLSWFAPVDSNSLVFHATGYDLDSTHHVVLVTDKDATQSTHTEWMLLAEGGERPPTAVTEKLADCLSGIDSLGSVIPDTLLVGSEIYGTSRGQTVFKDLDTARTVFQDAANRVLSEYKASESGKFSTAFPSDNLFPDASDGWWTRADYVNPLMSGVVVSQTVEDQNALASFSLPHEGDLVQVRNGASHPSGSGNTNVFYQRTAGAWVEFSSGDTTASILDTFWIGTSSEIRARISSLLAFLEPARASRVFFACVYEMLDQFHNCHWVTRTSYEDLTYSTSVARPDVNPRDELPLVVSAFEDSKPYSSKVRKSTATVSIEGLTPEFSIESGVAADDMTASVEHQDRIIKIGARYDRVSAGGREDRGWDTEPWDKHGWDDPITSWGDGAGKYRELARITTKKNVKEYTIANSVPSANTIEVVRDISGTISEAGTHTLYVSGTNLIIRFSSAPAVGTILVVRVKELLRDGDPHPTDSFLADDTEHAAQRAAPSVSGTGPDRVVANANGLGLYSQAHVADYLGGASDERALSHGYDHARITVTTSSGAHSGWDTSGWDTSGWDDDANTFPDHIDHISSVDSLSLPGEITEEVAMITEVTCTSAEESARGVVLPDSRLVPSKVSYSSGSGFDEVPLADWSIDANNTSITFFSIANGSETFEYTGASYDFASQRNVSSVRLEGVTLSHGSEWTGQGTKQINIAAGKPAGTIEVIHEIPTADGHVIRIESNIANVDANRSRITWSRTPMTWDDTTGSLTGVPAITKALSTTTADSWSCSTDNQSRTFTMELLFKASGVVSNSNAKPIIRRGGTSSNRQFGLSIKNNTLTTLSFDWSKSDGSLETIDMHSQMGSGWNHFAVTSDFDAKEFRFYQNGLLTKIYDYTSDGFVVSSWLDDVLINSGSHIGLEVMEFRLWNEVRTSDQIKSYMNGKIKSRLPDLYATFDGTKDAATGETGTITGTETYTDQAWVPTFRLEHDSLIRRDSPRASLPYAVSITALGSESVLENARTEWNPADGTLVLDTSAGYVLERGSGSWSQKWPVWSGVTYLDESSSVGWMRITTTGTGALSKWVRSYVPWTQTNYIRDPSLGAYGSFSGAGWSAVSDPNSFPSFPAGQSNVLQVTGGVSQSTAVLDGTIPVDRAREIHGYARVHVDGASLDPAPAIGISWLNDSGSEISRTMQAIDSTGDAYLPVAVMGEAPVGATYAKLIVLGPPDGVMLEASFFALGYRPWVEVSGPSTRTWSHQDAGGKSANDAGGLSSVSSEFVSFVTPSGSGPEGYVSRIYDPGTDSYLVPGPSGRAYDFDGSSGLVTLANSAGENPTILSASVLARNDAAGISTNVENIVSKWDTNSQRSWRLYIDLNERLALEVSADGSYTNRSVVVSDSAVTPDALNRYGFSWNAGGTLYVNGQAVAATSTDYGTGATAPYAGTAPVCVGGTLVSGSINSAEAWDGDIADARFYDTELTAAQHLAIYENPDAADPASTQADEVARLPMNENQSGETPVIALDHSGNGHHGIVSGTVTSVIGQLYPVPQVVTQGHSVRSVGNVLTYPEDFTNAAWQTGGTATASDYETINLPTINDHLRQTIVDSIDIGEARSAGFELKGTPGETITIRIAPDTGGAFEESYRDSAAWRINTAGSLIAYAAGEPRVADGSLLVEGAGTNLLLWSDDFTNSVWSETGTASVSDFETIIFSAEGDAIVDVISKSIDPGDVISAGIELKGTSGDTLTVLLGRSGAGTYEETAVDVTLTDDWVLYPITHTFLFAQTAFRFRMARQSGDTATTFKARRARANVGAALTSYIPTEATAVTRSAEVPLAKQGSGPELVTDADDLTATSWFPVAGSSFAAIEGGFTFSTAVANGFFRNAASDLVPVTAGAQYEFLWQAKDATGTVSWRLWDVTNSAEIDSEVYTTGSDWAEQSVTFTAPAGCENVYIYPAYNLTLDASVDVRTPSVKRVLPYPNYTDAPGFITATFKNLPDSGSDRTVISLSDGTTDEQVKVHVDASDDLILTANTAAGTPATATIASGIDLDAGGTVAVAYGPYYVDLPGASGDYISTPDSAANSITGDIDIVAYVQPDAWVETFAQRIVAKRDLVAGAAGAAYDFHIRENIDPPSLAFYTGVTYNSNAGFSATDGVGKWVRVTRDASTGVVRFYTSDDAVSVDPLSVTWTQLGTDVIGASGSLNDLSISVDVGALRSGTGTTAGFAGPVRRATVSNVIGSAAVLDLNPQDYTGSGSTFVSATTGETWTLNGNATIPDIARASYDGGAVAYAEKALDTSAMTELHIACDEAGAEQLNGEIVSMDAGAGAYVLSTATLFAATAMIDQRVTLTDDWVLADLTHTFAEARASYSVEIMRSSSEDTATTLKARRAQLNEGTTLNTYVPGLTAALPQADILVTTVPGDTIDLLGEEVVNLGRGGPVIEDQSGLRVMNFLGTLSGLTSGSVADNIWDGGATLTSIVVAGDTTSWTGTLVEKLDSSSGWSVWFDSERRVKMTALFSTTDGQWDIAIPAEVDSSDAPIILEIIYDSSSTDAPTAKANGRSCTVTVDVAPVGTYSDDSSGSYVVGGGSHDQLGLGLHHIEITNGLDRNQRFYTLATQVHNSNTNFSFT